MKFELDWQPTVEKGCVKPDFPFCAIRIRPDTNEDMAKLEHIKSSGLKLGQSNCHNSIEYYVVIEPPDLISKGKDNWKDERMKDNDDNRVKPNYSIKCCFGFHKWKYNKERKEAVIPYETQRICMCCGKRQTACFDGLEICWGPEIPKQVHPQKIKSSKEMYDELDKRTSTKEIDESLYQGCVMARHNFKKLKKADVNIEGLDDCIEKLDKALSIDSKISAAPPLGELCVYGNCPDCGSMTAVSNVGICDSCGATLKRIGCHCDGLPTAFGDVILMVTKKGKKPNRQFNKEGDDRK